MTTCEAELIERAAHGDQEAFRLLWDTVPRSSRVFPLGPDEWLLFKKLPEYAPRTKRKRVEVIQLPLPDLDENRPQAAFSS